MVDVADPPQPRGGDDSGTTMVGGQPVDLVSRGGYTCAICGEDTLVLLHVLVGGEVVARLNGCSTCGSGICAKRYGA